MEGAEAHEPYITDPRETYVRWAPIGALPMAFVGGIELRSLGEGQLSLLLGYDPPAGFDARLDFHAVQIAEFCTELSTRWQDNQVQLPRIGGDGPAAGHIWPLLEILESRWLASLPDTRLVPSERALYRHFEICSRSAQVAILTCFEPEARLIPLGGGWAD